MMAAISVPGLPAFAHLARKAGHRVRKLGGTCVCQFCRLLEAMSAEDKQRFFLREQYDWQKWALRKQLLPEGPWHINVKLAGRGSGKTHAGAQGVIQWAKSARFPRITLVARDAASCRDVMVEGNSGIMALSPPWFEPIYEPSKRRLTWPNGVTAIHYAAEEPKSLRGPQGYKGWADEIGAWKDLEKPHNAWDQLVIGTRLGAEPQIIVTSTPTPTKFISDLCLGPPDIHTGNRPVSAEQVRAKEWSFDVVAKDGTIRRTIVQQWSTRENAINLADGYVANIERLYGDSRLGRQELEAELLTKVEGALWTLEGLELTRRQGVPCAMKRVIVAVDPTRSDSPTDEAGIIAGALGEDGHCYVLADDSVKGTPHEWATAAIASFRRNRADAVIYEKNRMGTMVEELFKTLDRTVKLGEVTASEGKRPRAEPVSALYEQGKVHHVGKFPRLEDEMVTWDPSERQPSPNRMDALVWLVSELMLGAMKAPLIAR